MFDDLDPDRITALLRPQNPLLSIGQAAAASVGGGDFGANLSNLQARDTSRALAMLQMIRTAQAAKAQEATALRQERLADIAERRQALAEKTAEQRANLQERRLAATIAGIGRAVGPRPTVDERFLEQLSPEERQKALRIRMGLEPRATTGQGFEVTTPEGTTVRMGGSAGAKEEMERQAAASSVLTAGDLINRIATQADQDPTFGFTGGALRMVEGAAQQARSLLSRSMPPQQVDELLNPKGYTFGKLSTEAGKSAALQSNITQLAFTIALARNGGRGPITKADVQNAIEEIGAGAGSVVQLKSGLNEIYSNLLRQYELTQPPGALPSLLGRMKGAGIRTPQELFGQGGTPQQARPTAPDAIEKAREAIRRGADPEAVKKRLRENGIDPAGL